MEETKANNKVYLYTAAAGVVGLGALYVMTKPQQVLKDVLPPQTPSSLIQPEKGTHWACESDAEIKITLAKEGTAALPPITVMQQFQKAVKNQGNTPALSVEREGKWVSWTWQEYYDQTLQAARALIRLGFKRFDCINILGFNAPEWVIANIAAIAAGGKAAGIYTTNNPQACQYISEHSDAPVVVVENDMQLEKYLKIRDSLPKLKTIIMYTGAVPKNANVEGKAKVLSWAEFMALGEEQGEEANELKTRISQQQPGHCCTLIYTSGTTGNPKAVMISHDNATWTSGSSGEILLANNNVNKEGEATVSYLPLSHIAAQMLDIHQPMSYVAKFNNPFTVWFARPDALKGSLSNTMKHVRPTLFFGVPRVWEKMEEAMKHIGSKTQGVQKAIATWAKGLGLEGFKNQELGGSGYLPAFHRVAKSVVFSKIKAALGLQRCRMMYTGAAPIAHSTLYYFGSLDLPVLELFGMSECTGPHTVARPKYFKVGTTGPNMPGVETKIEHMEGRDKPQEGEICMRGRNVMMGYMKDPVKTKESIDAEGFLHSGDVGKVDEYGCLAITGRIKELLITAGGENVAPVPVEDLVKKELPALSNAMMIGDRRKYNNILLTLRTAPDEKTGGFSNLLAAEALKVDPNAKTIEDAQTSAKWKTYIEDGLKRANKQAVSNAQTVQKYAILPTDFSVPGGELTPTLKLKRNVVLEKYKDVVEALYKE